VQYRIASDTFRQVSSGRVGGGSVEDNWTQIRRGLEASPNEPSFVVARGVSKEANKWLLIFFMPEGALETSTHD
jgi:hypothetical protein